MKKLLLAFFTLFIGNSQAQNSPYWQQHVGYKMTIDMNVGNYQYDGAQTLVYTNNSPDTLNKVFYHLYFNAFQPGSEMDMRVQNIVDPDRRMVNNLGTKEKPVYESRIAKLKPDEIGFIKVLSLKQDGKAVSFKVVGTILKVKLNKPLKPGTSTSLKMTFKGQVPVQVRRSGRNNKDGVALSMTQWYPKLVEYDFEGWHADPYIAREFHGVWGDFDVTIKIDKNYTVGGTGYLQNPQEVGHGYENPEKKVKKQRGKKLTWHFIAPNVHDFTWAADPDYIHEIKRVPGGSKLHFLYKNDTKVTANWQKMQEQAVKIMQYYNKTVGAYPYKQYSIIQGGDGGMEYGMCTLITGGANLEGLIGTMRHEMAHSWFQFALATNESEHPWMDEGFTSFIATMASNTMSDRPVKNPFERTYGGYYYLVKSGKQEPLSTHADRYNTNMAYGIASYVNGQIFLSQLGYVIGWDNLMKTLKNYYAHWKMKHPTPTNFIREAEKTSGLELGWYLNEWVETTHIIDYGIKSVADKSITLERIGAMPMPIDVRVTYVDGSTENFNIPLRMQYGHKPTAAKVLDDWAWAYPTYTFKVDKAVKKVTIDPSKLMADVNQKNNVFEK
ncbi:MAG: M1 family metallopeptidase [Flavobacteriaceae bacterium]|nr:M1 family metallopeptidase [Flavobacteriaceae bacterium]